MYIPEFYLFSMLLDDVAVVFMFEDFSVFPVLTAIVKCKSFVLQRCT